MQLIDQISEDTYDPTMFEDEEKKRILAAIDEKIAGKQIVAAEPHEPQAGGQVIDLMEALRASLGAQGRGQGARPRRRPRPRRPSRRRSRRAKERKGVKRAAKVEEAVAAPARARAKK